MEVLSVDEASRCFLRLLHGYVHDMQRAGFSLEPFLLRPSIESRAGFKPSALSSSSLNKSFQERLAEHGLGEGETLHGVRRGTMQHQRAQGASVEEVGRRALHAAPFATTELYLDTSRETGGAERLHNLKRRRL